MNPLAWIYYASFIVIAVFVVVNLFIAVVINNLEAAKKEHPAVPDAKDPRYGWIRSIDALKEGLAELERQVRQSQRDYAQHASQAVGRELNRVRDWDEAPVWSKASGGSRS